MISKIKNYLNGKDPEFLRHLWGYLIVGGGNALLTIGLYVFFLTILDLDYRLAFSISWLIGVIATYIVNFTWVFKPEDKLQFRQRFPKYITVYLISYFVSLYLIYLIVDTYGVHPVLAEFFVIPVIVLINFVGIKYWAMKKDNQPAKVAIYTLFILLFMYSFSGIFPLARFESDSMGICNGCYEILRTGEWGSNFFSYSYDMQAGSYWLIIMLIKLFSLEASIAYSLLSAIFAIGVFFLTARLLSKLLNYDFIIITIILLLFQEIYTIGFYANSAIFAAFFWLLGVNILYSVKSWWKFPVTVFLFALAFWCRVDIAFAMVGILPLIFTREKIRTAFLHSFILGSCTIILGFILFKLSNVDITGFTHYSSDFAGVVTKGDSDLGFLNIFSLKSHLGFFSLAAVFLIIMGLIMMIKNKDYKLILLVIFPVIIYYLFNSTHVFASKHLYYNLLFWSIPVTILIKNGMGPKTRQVFYFLFIFQYLVGWQFLFSSIPWQEKDYAQLKPFPVIADLVKLKLPLPKKIPVNITLGSGTKIPTSDEIMLSSGIIYSPVMWQQLKMKYKISFAELERIITKENSIIKISTSQSSSQHVFNVLLENGWEYVPDGTIKFGFDKWHDFRKNGKEVRVFINRFQRDIEDFLSNFEKMNTSEFYHIAIWDWENYLLRENLSSIAFPVSDFVYRINLNEWLKGRRDEGTKR